MYSHILYHLIVNASVLCDGCYHCLHLSGEETSGQMSQNTSNLTCPSQPYKIFLFSRYLIWLKAAPFISHPNLTFSSFIFSLNSTGPVSHQDPVDSLSLSQTTTLLIHHLLPRKLYLTPGFMSELSICSPDIRVACLVFHVEQSSSNPNLFKHSCFKLVSGSLQGIVQRAIKLFTISLSLQVSPVWFLLWAHFHALVFAPTVPSECSFTL